MFEPTAIAGISSVPAVAMVLLVLLAVCLTGACRWRCGSLVLLCALLVAAAAFLMPARRSAARTWRPTAQAQVTVAQHAPRPAAIAKPRQELIPNSSRIESDKIIIVGRPEPTTPPRKASAKRRWNRRLVLRAREDAEKKIAETLRELPHSGRAEWSRFSERLRRLTGSQRKWIARQLVDAKRHVARKRTVSVCLPDGKTIDLPELEVQFGPNSLGKVLADVRTVRFTGRDYSSRIPTFFGVAALVLAAYIVLRAAKRFRSASQPL